MKEIYKSRVYTDRPDYAGFDAPAKFQAISSIVERRLIEHPNAICSYSGGADSDINLALMKLSAWKKLLSRDTGPQGRRPCATTGASLATRHSGGRSWEIP